MPTIAIVDGVKIAIYPKDHLPPHLHARYAEFEAQISIATGDVLEGKLPAAKMKAVKAWLEAHRGEVAFVWEEIRAHRYSGGMIG
ncbi:MAG: DUF4160 domain-containing protein [Hyphomicrobiales bacterium]